MNKLGIYIHWPYCISKCPYCDFNSHKLTNYDPNVWLKAYKNQIKIIDDEELLINYAEDKFIEKSGSIKKSRTLNKLSFDKNWGSRKKVGFTEKK